MVLSRCFAMFLLMCAACTQPTIEKPKSRSPLTSSQLNPGRVPTGESFLGDLRGTALSPDVIKFMLVVRLHHLATEILALRHAEGGENLLDADSLSDVVTIVSGF